MNKEYILKLSEEELESLLWLVEGNNAFTDLAVVLDEQAKSQGLRRY